MHQIFSHSIMFHHFHGSGHLPAQGSITGPDLRYMLNWLNSRYTLLGAHLYKEKFINKRLKNSDICLSFDDALKCQFDIAAPILSEFGIDAFFFVYSSAFSDNPDPLEIYRYFRTTIYKTIDEFYEEFFSILRNMNPSEFKKCLDNFSPLEYLRGRPYYSENDKKFRYLRDHYLTKEQYHQFMNEMMNEKNFNIEEAKNHLWMTAADLTDLAKKGHLIGLHSNNHPTQMSKLPKRQQMEEYKFNQDHLYKILGKKVDVMSHPCGDYNKDTLDVLNDLGVCMGFRANMEVPYISSSLEIPRENHSNIFKEMRT